MGTPKHLLRHPDGRSWLARALATLAPHAAPLHLLGAGDLPDDLPEPVERLADPPEVSGPLAGLLAATRHAPEAAWLVLACDLPRVDDQALTWLVDQRRPGVAAVLPRTPDGRPQPTFALYEPAAGALLEALWAEGGRGPSALVGRPGVVTPEAPSWLTPRLANANRPEDLAGLDLR